MSRSSRTGRWRTLGPLVVLAVLVAADVLLGPDVVISAAFAVAAVVAGAFASVRVTAAVAALAAVLAAVSGFWNDNWGTLQWTVRLAVAVVLGALAVVSAVIRVRRERSLSRMTAIAEVAQRAVLRTLPATVGGVDLAARYISAAEDALVGGDLYEVADTAYGVRVIVGDVRGKGVDAMQLAAVVLGAFRRAAATAPSVGCVAIDVDAVVGGVAGDEDFVTAVVAEFHADRTVTVVNCGHPPPVMVFAGPLVTEVDTGEPQVPLGLGTTGRAATFQMPARSRLLLFTDGLTESRDVEGRFFPLMDQADVLSGNTLESSLDGLLARLHRHVGHRLRDDVALVLVGHRDSHS